jgi:hypothetical protein
MAGGPAKLMKKRFDEADEHRLFPRGTMNVVTVGGVTLGLSRLEPGWRWSENLKPIAKTDSCQVEHLVFMVSGRMHARLDDGTEGEFVAGDVGYIPPGHDGWVVGDEPAVFLEIAGADMYAKAAT